MAVRLLLLWMSSCALVHGYGGDYTNGACGSTDYEVAVLCDVPDGVCHSWIDSTSNEASYRGTWMEDMVFVHEQVGNWVGDEVSASKAML